MTFRVALFAISAVLLADLAIGVWTGRTRLLLTADRATNPAVFWPTLMMGALCIAALMIGAATL